MANTDASFEELFVRVVPMEVCCIHNSSSSSSAAKHAQQQQHKAAACLHHSRSPSAHAHFQDANLMPGTPNGSRSRHMDEASGLYPFLSSTEVPGACCFCPNCCSNSYVTPEQSAANAALTDAGLDLMSVAVQRLTVRVLGQKNRFGANGRQLPGCYRIELSSDSILFFLFVGTITEAGFLDIKEACDLSLAFQQLPGLLLQLLDLLVRQPSTYLARLLMQADGSAAMEFAQTLGFKTMSLLELPRLEPAGSAVVRGYVTARHNSVLERCASAEAELAELKALVRQRCPNLLLQASKIHHSSKAEALA